MVVYNRTSGLTQPHRATGAADARQFAAVTGVDGRVAGPAPSRDGKAIETIISADLGNNGWSSPTFFDSVRRLASTGADGLTVHVTGPADTAADSAKACKGIDSTLL